MRRRHLLAAAAMGLALSGLHAAPAAREEIRVLFPPADAVLLPGTHPVIVKGGRGDLRVDGKARPWEGFAPPVRAARVELAAGRHEIRVGDRVLAVRVVPGAKPGTVHDEGEAARAHSIGAGVEGCAACHETGRREGKTAVGALRPAEACLKCHPPVQFEAIHSHPLEPIEHCQTCHALHASRRKALLSAPAKKLCSACHES